MTLKNFCLTSVMGLCGVVSLAAGADLERMESEIAKQYGKEISEKLTRELDDPVVKFDVDADLATGLHAEQDGIIIVPMKGMKANEINPDVEKENGAGLCYLFMSPCYHPQVDGKPLDESKLLKVAFQDGEGNSREALALIVTVKHAGGDDWRLFAFGNEKMPLINVPFGESSGSSQGIVDISVDSPKEMKANLTFTVVGKYSASFPISAK